MLLFGLLQGEVMFVALVSLRSTVKGYFDMAAYENEPPFYIPCIPGLFVSFWLTWGSSLLN